MTPFSKFSRRIGRYALILAAALACSAARGQAVPSTQPSETMNRANNPADFPTVPHDPEQARMLRDMGRQRNAIRQKEIVDDTNQLLDLASKLKDAVDKSNKDELSLSVVNTAAEIEKLAKVVKEKMRDGQ
jgi:hypothetical protein